MEQLRSVWEGCCTVRCYGCGIGELRVAVILEWIRFRAGRELRFLPQALIVAIVFSLQALPRGRGKNQ